MARRTQTYAIRLAVEGGGQVKAELVTVGQSGEQSLKRIESAGGKASSGLVGLGRQAELLRTGIRTLGGALAGMATVGGLAALVDRSLSAADAIGKTADKIGVGVEALQELRFAAKASGVEQQTLDMALQRFTRRAAEAAQGTGEAKDALAQMGIALRDQSGNLRSSEDLLGDVADAFARIEDPAERVRLAFKLFDSEGVALVNLLRGGSSALEEMRERARDLGIVLDEHLVRDAERARTELDTLSQVISANLTHAALEAAPVIADLSSWLADVAGKAGIAWERLFDAPEDKSLRTLRYELDLTESTIAKLEGRIQELRESPRLGFTTFIDTAQISALQGKIDELSRARGQTQARIAFLEGPPEQPGSRSALPAAPDDTAGVKDRAERLQRLQQELESTLFGITHQGSERIIAEHERRIAEIEAVRARGRQQRRGGRPADRAVRGGARCAALAAAGQGGRSRREGPGRQREDRGRAGCGAPGAGADRARSVRRPGAEPAVGGGDGTAATRGRAARCCAVRRAAGAPGAAASHGRGPLGHRPDPDGNRAACGRGSEAQRAAPSGCD
jgi:hypothetical protein